MLLKDATLEGIAAGAITLVFRRWKRATVKTGGTLNTRIGQLAIEAVDKVAQKSITDEQARQAGFADRADVLATLRSREGEVYRIQLRLAGPDPRIALRKTVITNKAEMLELQRKLARMDDRSDSGPWTLLYLRLLRDNPGRRAIELAESLGLEKKPFKARVRRLKALGLTISLKIGYELSPRGASFLARTERALTDPDAVPDPALP